MINIPNYDPLTQSTFLSPFLTTRRNIFLDFLANLIIFPAYILCIDKIIIQIVFWYPNIKPFTFIMWGIALLPLIGISISAIHWRLGFKERKRNFGICILLILTFLITDRTHTIYLFILTTSIAFCEFLFRRLFARRKLRNFYSDPTVYILTCLEVFLIWGIILWININPSFQRFNEFFSWGIIVFILLSIPIPLVLGIQDSWATYYKKSNKLGNDKSEFSSKMNLSDSRFLFRLFLRALFFLLIWTIFNIPTVLNLPKNDFAVAILGLTIILIIANPSRFFSRQLVNLKRFFRYFRDDSVRKLVSPSNISINIFTILVRTLRSYLFRNRHWLIIVISFILDFLILPSFLYHKNYEKDISKLVMISTIAFIIQGGTIGVVLIIQNRPRHIVLPFVAVEEENDHQLTVIANLLRQAFVEQLHQLSMLLELRQVENLSSRDDRGLAVFVASGSNQDLVEQLQSLGNFELLDLKIPFGSAVSSLILRWADTQVSGTVQRQEDNSIAVWVELVFKNGQTIGVDLIILPEDSVEHQDGIQIANIAHTLAVKMVLKLGQHSHIATSYESLRFFLNGLQASYERNWWLAISYFHKAVHIEGAENNSFGYGYYHLGALLMSQGEIEEGMEYLEHAEALGPPLAETQYMLALGLYYLYQDRLHIDRTVFTDIEYKCRAALSLRTIFPEVYHLLGSAYYQRGRLRERSWTKNSYSNEKNQNLIIDPIPKHYESDYFKAKDKLLRAIKLYDKALKNLPYDINARVTVFNEQARLVEDRMAATHRAADVFRSLEMHAEADSFYREVRIAFPRNNRTLVDIAKTYCLAKNWGKADEFLRTDVFNNSEMKWDKSACFYMAWVQLGGVSELGNKCKSFVDKSFILLYEKFANRIDIKTPTALSNTVWNAVCWLDFALHQYPSYLYSWRQLEWQPEFEKAIKYISKDSLKWVSEKAVYKSNLNNENWNVYHLQFWIVWRILGIASEELNDKILKDNYLIETAKRLARINISNDMPSYCWNDMEYPHSEFTDCFRKLHAIRDKYANILIDDNNNKTIKSLKRRFECLSIGINAYQMWKDIFNKMKGHKSSSLFASLAKNEPSDTITTITFGERWAIDVFAEFSLLITKLLIEGKAFDYAKKVSELSGLIMKNFISISKNSWKDTETPFLGRLYCKKGARPSSKQQKFNIIAACSRKTHNTCNQR